MAIKALDKVVITNPVYQDSESIHFVSRVYNYGNKQEIALACYCDLFTEDNDEGVMKVDNELAVTCKDCINELQNI